MLCFFRAMKFIISSFILISVFSFTVAYSQSYTVSGKVTDRVTGKPLQNTNVYINNSSRGTITNSEGHFSISSLVPGKYDLVVSYIGFQTVVKSLEITNENKQLEISLDKKEQILREVLILTDETRRRYLKIFKENLLGYTEAARRCKITNIDAVGFTSGPAKGDIIAYADEDLVIENPESGYIIHFQMTDFYFNTNTGASWFFGYMRFEDMARGGEPSKKWIKRRNDNFYGSSMHFYRSLVKKELAKEGYKLAERRELIDTTNNKKTVTFNANGVSVQNNRRVIAVPVTEDSILFLYSDSAYKIFELQLKGSLHIAYRKSTKLKNEMNEGGAFIGQPNSGTFSGLRIRQAPVLIDYRGLMLTPMNIIYDGIWVYERMANMLPKDFEPE